MHSFRLRVVLALWRFCRFPPCARSRHTTRCLASPSSSSRVCSLRFATSWFHLLVHWKIVQVAGPRYCGGQSPGGRRHEGDTVSAHRVRVRLRAPSSSMPECTAGQVVSSCEGTDVFVLLVRCEGTMKRRFSSVRAGNWYTTGGGGEHNGTLFQHRSAPAACTIVES